MVLISSCGVVTLTTTSNSSGLIQTANKERKSATEIVKTTVGDIKETIKEDFKEIKEELKKPIGEKKKEEQPKVEDPQELTQENTKEKPKKKKKVKKILLFVMTVMLILTIAGIIFIYVKVHDGSRNKYQVKGYDTSEIIKKNYIDGFSNISSTGVFNFSLPQDDVNELLSKSVEKLNDKYIESIYYESGEDSHHYFYVDLKVPVIKTRVVVDTISVADPTSNSYYLAIQNCTIGKMPAFGYLSKKGYFSQEFIGKIAEYSNLPISYVEEYNSIKYEPLKYMSEFPKGDIGDLIFDVVNQDTSVISLNQSDLGFKIDFSSLRNPDFISEEDSSLIVDVYSRVKTALDDIDSSTLPIDEPYVVETLSEKELSKLVNNSFVTVSDDELTSTLTSNKTKFSIVGANVTFVDDVTIRFSLNISINDYVVNLNVNAEIFSDIYDFETYFFLEEECSIENIKYSGGDNLYVRFINEILNDSFSNLMESQPKAFNADPLVDQFSINLNGISDELSDISLKLSPKEIRINLIDKQLKFIVTRMF